MVSKLQVSFYGFLVLSTSVTIGPLIPMTEAAEQAQVTNVAGQTGKVFLDYTQKELDDAYDQRVWAANAGQIIQSWPKRSEEIRNRYKPETHKYGPDDAETLDVFRSYDADAPTMIFIHGGAWRAGGKDDFSLLADSFVPYGANLIVLNFDNIPDERIVGMVDQIRHAMAWIYGKASELRINPEKLYVSGHSSGAHLVGVILTTDWKKEGMPTDVIKGGLSISGMFDLAPVLLSARSSYVKLNDDEVGQLSPMRHLDKIRSPILVYYGGKESPEFQRHSRDFDKALKQSSHPSELVVLPDLNHFEMFNSLADTDGAVAIAARRMMGLTNKAK